MATYRQRGKKKLWDYRIFNEKSELIASGSGFKTKREAMNEATRIEQQKSLKMSLSGDVTLYDLWFEWFNLIIKPSDLADTTKNKYFTRGAIIKKLFGNQKVSKIKHSAYQRILNEYAEKYTKNHVRRLNSDIRKAINFAKRDGVLLDDFTAGVVIAGKRYVKEVEDKYLHSIADYELLTDYLEGHVKYSEGVIYYLLLVLFRTGLRVGEALALTWEDIDFYNLELKTYRRFSGDKGVFSPPKTKTSIRTIPISQKLSDILFQLKIDQEKCLSKLSIINHNNQLFFDFRYGIPSNSAINKSLKRLLKQLSIDSTLTATGARHTYGSYLLAKGVDIWVVSRLMGHKDITQLIETYGHVLSEVINKEHEVVRDLIT
ncbi:site-specific integrase [Streptococcus agalactiae]|uniref:tyrosine-type recombinase/integrase n=2 Tax=Streptococcus agalactiae TaxID=1311 RepID=UPI001374C27B|nr:site-specific integrase [Streptococcus agalactiae]KAF1200995.1 site-specific integrase [Streptococcus agalactiae]KAF1217054.1 site-specific integrase [Streptococcus agalactiae]MBU8845946.1 site-specific integrase [Streptococcus agalactiae]MCD0073342.1 site-specific integrase [Streptococcus agalactiae]MCD0077716.1 site-specific integrase [Streptococcus agalactiae]